jgi:hypothetical protein
MWRKGRGRGDSYDGGIAKETVAVVVLVLMMRRKTMSI